ncbi:hypothetical protein AKJ16_DCAP09302 [Drosera capensis]
MAFSKLVMISALVLFAIVVTNADIPVSGGSSTKPAVGTPGGNFTKPAVGAIAAQRVYQGAACQRGRTCARDHAGLAVFAASACRRAPPATTTSAPATPASPPAVAAANAHDHIHPVALA